MNLEAKYKKLIIDYHQRFTDMKGLEFERDRLKAEVAKWKDEYFNLTKFANDFEAQRDLMRALLVRWNKWTVFGEPLTELRADTEKILSK